MFIFCLAVVPCTDALCSHTVEVTEESHDHPDDTEDGCTPFCTCNCCGMTINIVDIEPLEIFRPNHIYEYSHSYAFNYSYDHSWSIWHPPAFC